MSFAVLTKWNKSKHGFSEGEPCKYMATKFIVLSKLDENDKKYFNSLIKYNNYYINSPVNSNIFPIKNTYLYLDRMFANINYSFLNFVKKLKNRYSRLVTIKNDIWSKQFKNLRGRYPTYNEYLENKLI